MPWTLFKKLANLTTNVSNSFIWSSLLVKILFQIQINVVLFWVMHFITHHPNCCKHEHLSHSVLDQRTEHKHKNNNDRQLELLFGRTHLATATSNTTYYYCYCYCYYGYGGEGREVPRLLLWWFVVCYLVGGLYLCCYCVVILLRVYDVCACVLYCCYFSYADFKLPRTATFVMLFNHIIFQNLRSLR